jgi:hypothetical protein
VASHPAKSADMTLTFIVPGFAHATRMAPSRPRELCLFAIFLQIVALDMLIKSCWLVIFD